MSMMDTQMKTYTEMSKFKTYKDRYRYLRIGGKVGDRTFGYERYLNQVFYTSSKWRQLRNSIIIRDEGNDLGVDGYSIKGSIYIHHINPLTKQQIESNDPAMFDPENLICVSFDTHQAIHYGNEDLLPEVYISRSANDTKLW